jgi:hypothetical protein
VLRGVGAMPGVSVPRRVVTMAGGWDERDG